MKTASLTVVVASLIIALCPGSCPQAAEPWAFAVMCDGRPGKYRSDEGMPGFLADLQALKEHYFDRASKDRPAPEFMLMPGDIDPPRVTDKLIHQVLGDDFPWAPVLGNHERYPTHITDFADIFDRHREKMGLHAGPAGTQKCQYYFTWKNLLVVAIDVYWDGADYTATDRKWFWKRDVRPDSVMGTTRKKIKDGKTLHHLDSEIVEANHKWIETVLAESKAPYKIVSGHEPAWPFFRYTRSALSDHPESRDRFWQMLAGRGVQVYFCGHTHYYTAYQWLGNDDPNRWGGYSSKLIPEPLGTWQIDSGASRGTVYTEKRKNSYHRVIIYCKVTDEAMEVEALISLRAEDGKTWGKWHVPENGSQIHAKPGGRPVYRWKIYPDPKRNLPAPAEKATPVAMPAAAGAARGQ